MARPEFKRPTGPDPGPSAAAFIRAAGTSARTLEGLTTSEGRAESAARRLAESLEVLVNLGANTSQGGGGGGSSSGSSSPQAGGLDKVGDQAGLLGGQIRAALTSGLAPLEGIGARVAAQVNQVGGTITTLARRLDAAFKFDAAETGLAKIQSRLRDGVSQAANKAADSLGLLEKATAKLGPAADKAITVYRGFSKVQAYLGSRGDVAGKSLDQLQKIKSIDFSSTAKGAGQLTNAVARISPTAASAAVSVKGIGLQIVAALGVVGVVYKLTTAFTDFIGGGIKGAIDLNETLSKTREVFGQNSASIEANAAKQAKAFGLPKGAILDAASSFGLIFNGAKVAGDQSAMLANKLTNLAADASSFYNVPLPDALEKIRSGLVGESEPLRAFGILLNEQNVAQEAVRLGLAKSAKAVSDKAKVTARASLIEKGLATASGDLARTQGAAANQFRQAGGGLDNFATAIGQVVLPTITAGIGIFNELLATIVEVFETNQPLIEAWADHVFDAVEYAGSILRNLGTYFDIAVLRIKEFAINGLSYIETIPGNLAIIADYIGNNWYTLLLDAFTAVESLIGNLAKNFQDFGGAVFNFFKDPTKGFDFKGTALFEGFRALSSELPELIRPGLISVQDEVDAKFKDIESREKERSDKIAAAASANKKKPAAAAEAGPVAGMFADLAEKGSKEAYSAVLKFANPNNKGNKPLDSIADTSKQQLEIDRQILKAIQAQGAPAPPPEAFAF